MAGAQSRALSTEALREIAALREMVCESVTTANEIETSGKVDTEKPGFLLPGARPEKALGWVEAFYKTWGPE